MSGVHMSSIPADAASYYATYNLSGAERRDNAGNIIPAAVANAAPNTQPLSTHDFFHHHQSQQQQQQQHQHDSPLLHTSASQYHPQPHHTQSSHTPIAQYSSQHPHLAMSAASHHSAIGVVAVGVGDSASPYQTSGFTHYAHPAAYHTHHSASISHPAAHNATTGAAVDPASAVLAVSAAVDHDYSVMSVGSAFHPTTPPIPLHQPQHQHMGTHLVASVGDMLTVTSNGSGASGCNPGMRFECILEAPTASAQKADETSLTYLNKGQLYGVSLVDKMHSDMTYCTTLRIAFHEDSHRKSAATYWNFWLNQQENPRAARAIELDKAGSIGVVAKETKQFDRVTFQWQGRRGAKVMIRFNCLSTDFSRIKGVKGIPLRIHLDTFHALPGSGDVAGSYASELSASLGQMSSPIPSLSTSTTPAMAFASASQRSALSHQLSGTLSSPVSPTSATGNGSLDSQQPQSATATFAQHPVHATMIGIGTNPDCANSNTGNGNNAVTGKIIERCYARIKLFRDKGAERKNKDDQRHLEKMWEKQKTKLGLTGVTSEQQQPHLNEFTKLFAPVLQVTAFVEYTLQGDSCDAEEPMIVDDLWTAGGSAVAAAAVATAALESPGSTISTPITGLSSMSIGMPGISLSGLSSPLGSAAVAYMRKRSSEDSDILIPNKRQFSPQTLTSEFHSATTATTLGPNSLELIGVDPTYVPAPRKKKAVLAIYARFHNENVYRAIYLEQLTVADLVAKVTQQLEAKLHSNVEIIHKTKKGLAVKVDDQVIAHLDDEQDMDVQCSFASDTGALTIYLDY
ncbi:hypothetical protein GGI25_004852 [Coemansia spiralis]|uniref:Grh/CP2 DB domain-containing protein n=1 Tax=Coemansia spiralis TaxID=417178 RepID=A0A9W8FZP8_9FUNG|nr:hypothetical protein GGI25_004852 [Coemansia spiralis]